MTDQRVERRFAAILAADVAGYSRLVGTDEEGTVARLRALRAELINPAISRNRGRVFHTAGDSILAEFGSVVDAVRAALDVQPAMLAHNADFAPEQRIEFRVGIHLGDVIVESDADLMGDGVNIAARLEAIARPGAICLSEDAYRQVRGRLELAADDLGEQSLKNIAERVRVYSLAVGGVSARARAVSPPRRRGVAVVAPAGIVALIVIGCIAFYFLSGQKPATVASIQPPSRAQSTAVPRLSIVVLPFANLSGAPNSSGSAAVGRAPCTWQLSTVPPPHHA